MNKVEKQFGIIIGTYGVLAVALGAFGAHGLKEVLPADSLLSYKTGVSYHFYHLFAMIASYFVLNKSRKLATYAYYCFAIGILFFSGSIYLLATREVIGLVTYKWLGPITPFGGLLFIVGWILLGVAFNKRNVNEAA